MAVTVRKAGVFKPTEQPYINVSGTWKPAKKVYLRNAGTWKEVWPRHPQPAAERQDDVHDGGVATRSSTPRGRRRLPAGSRGTCTGCRSTSPTAPAERRRRRRSTSCRASSRSATTTRASAGRTPHGEKVQVEVWTVRKDSTYEIEPGERPHRFHRGLAPRWADHSPGGAAAGHPLDTDELRR